MSDQIGDVAAALANYRRETQSAQLAFFQGKIDALERYTELSDKQKLDKLAPYFGIGSWGSTGHGSSITSPRQLLIAPGEPGYVNLGIYSDGTLPAAPEGTQSEYLDKLHSLLREAGGDDVPRPAEFAQLLTMTDAISDMDFWQSGSAGLHGTCEELTRNNMSDRQAGQQSWYSHGWHVVAGWRCAWGNPGVTYMLYARKYDGSGSPEDQEFKWRVCTWAGSEVEDDVFFPSIADFLNHKCQRLQRWPEGWQDQWKGPPVDSEEWNDDSKEDDDEEEDEYGENDE